jgi:peptidoglycan/LPS O-acetylase OafA/YrhL
MPMLSPAVFLKKTREYLSFKRTPGQIAELDGLRGIAILLVVFRHGVMPFHAEGQAMFPVSVWGRSLDLAAPLMNGWMGVDLFFVLSGFLISQHILSRHHNANGKRVPLRTYLCKRALRILPAYYAFLLIVVMGAIPLYSVGESHLPLRVGYHILFLQDYLPSNIVVSFWSLGVEEKFYLSIPIVLAVMMKLKSLRLRYWLMGILATLPLLLRIVTSFVRPEITEYKDFFITFRSPFHLSLDGLLLGCICAVIFHNRERHSWTNNPSVTKTLFWGGSTLIVALICFRPHLDHIDLFTTTVLFSLLAVGFAAILLSLVLAGGWHSRFFKAQWLQVFAKISYSLYLVHIVFVPWALALASGFGTLTRVAVFIFMYAALSLAAALALHFAVEKPFLLLKDRMGEKKHGKSQIASAVAAPALLN